MISRSEGNKLIAEFMGYRTIHKRFQYRNWNSSDESYFEWSEGDIVCDEWGNEVNLYPDGDPLFDIEDLPFSRWDWIMPVLEKICGLGFMYVIINNYCGISKKERLVTDKTPRFESSEVVHESNGIYTKKAESTLDAVYIAVTKFIEWYNLNKT